jgi:fatty acid desaturase
MALHVCAKFVIRTPHEQLEHAPTYQQPHPHTQNRYWLSTFIDGTAELSAVLPYVLWPMYWWWQGAVLTGVWVIAHECGHRAFSNSIFFGDCVGMVLHSALLVP